MAKGYLAFADTGAEARFWTITEARQWAKDFGDTATRVCIYRLKTDGSLADARPVALSVRDTSGSGRRWFKACI